MKQTVLPDVCFSPAVPYGVLRWRWLVTATIVLLLNVICLSANAQGRQVSGVITETNGSPLPGVTIQIKGTASGTASDAEGRYSLSVPSNNAVLVVSYIGYAPKEIPVGNQTTINVTLSPDAKALQEVVVVGYGTQKRSDVTGSIASVDEKAIREVPAANVGQAIQGRAAGVEIQSTSPRPGAAPQIRIRGSRSLSGSNDPLLIVDGIPYDGSISDLNPDDIASLDILKDASATAIYGSRGSNGVILITTKRGRVGNAQVSYNGYHGVTTVARKYDVYNAAEFRAMRELSGYGQPTPYLPDELESIELGRETDWQDLVYKNGMMTNHDLGVSGGTENTQFSIGGGYFKQTTVLPGQAFTRYSLRATVDQQISKRIKVGLNTINTLSFTDGESANPMFQVLSLTPLSKAYLDNGEINRRPGYPREENRNPLLLYNNDVWKEQRRRIRTFNSLYGEVQILDGLKYRLNVGLDYRQDEYGIYGSSDSPMRNGAVSEATVDNGDAYNYTIENILNYEKTFGDKHKINFTGLYSVQEFEGNNTRVVAQNIVADYAQFYNLGLANNLNSATGAYTKWNILSYMGRLNYSFADRYVLTLTARADGSSRLAPGNKWHYYPAVAAAWNIINESFLQNQSLMTNLRLRAGYGQTSNTAIDPYRTLGSMSRESYNFGTTGTYGYYLSTLANPNLGWEFTSAVNAGIDFGFFSNRITGSFDVYQQKTTDILLNKTLPATAGISGSFLTNVGATQNKGLEFALTTVNIESENGFNWSTDLNFSLNRGKILALADPNQTRDVGNGWFVGYPMDVIYDYRKIGIWQTGEDAAAYGQKAGQIKVEDVNKDSRINGDDRQILGSLQAKWQGGITNRFAYKGFDLSVVAYARVGGKLISTIHQPSSALNSLQGRRNYIKVDYWTPENPTNAYPKPDANQENPLYGSTLGYFDASFLKIRSINLGYNLPGAWAGKAGMSSARVYLTAQNPFVLFSPYIKAGGLDPEPTGLGGSDTAAVPNRLLTVGANTPLTRSFLLGVNLKF